MAGFTWVAKKRMTTVILSKIRFRFQRLDAVLVWLEMKPDLAPIEYKKLRFFGACAPKKWPFGQLRIEAERL
jgi:hypothetical protein